MKISGAGVRAFFFLICIASVTAYADMTLDQLIKSKKYSDAVAYADAKLPSTARTADVWVKIGIANEELGTTEKALACFLVASRMDVKSYDAQLGIARVYNKLNQPDNALTFAKKAMDLQSTGEASWEYAKACMALKRPADAQEALEKVIQSDPSNAAASRGLAEIYWQQKEYKKAIPLLKVAYASNPNPEDAYKIGRSLLESNKIDSAIFYLKEAISRNPNFYAANLDLARAYFLKDKFLAAANEYEKVADKVRLSAMDQYNRAICQEKTGSMDAALKAYRAAADAFGPDKSPEATTAHLKAGNADLEKKNYESALVHFRYIAAADSEGTRVPEIQFLLADAYSGAGNMPKAIACLEKALATDNKNVEAYARLADLYQKSGAPDKARQIYEKITTINPNDPKIFITLGDYSLKSKKYTDALRYYEKSYIIDKNVKAAAGMSAAAAALEQWDKAIDAAESAIRLDPSLIEPRVVLSKAFLRSDRYKEAKEQLDFLVGKKPFDVEYWKQLAYCYKQLNDPVNMSYADKKIVEMDKTNVESRLRLGAYLLAQREYKQAFDIYKELSVLTPQNPEVFKSLYEITLNSGDKAMAAGYLKKYIAFNPNDAVAQRNLGNLYYEVKNYDAALMAFRAAIKLDPTIKGVYKPYADIVIAKGLKEELATALAGAVNAGEADGNMYAMLGGVYQKQGLCPKAIELYQKALAKDPRNMPVISGLAQCQARVGDVDGAIVSYEQVLALNANAIDEYKALGELYMKRNKEADAVGVFKKYLDKRRDDSRVARAVGEYAYKQKNYDEAARYFAMVTGEDTRQPDFLMHFGQACYFAKNYVRASALMNQLALLTPLNAEVFKTLYTIALQDSTQKGQAAGYLKKYVALKPSDATAQRTLGDMCYDQKDASGALTAYRKAIALDPTVKGLYKRYFELATALGIQTDIAAALSGAINAGEADAGMYAAQGNYYERQGACAKAIPMYQKALQSDPKNTAVLMALAGCQVKIGAMTEASVTYEQVLALNPADARVNKMLGDMYLKQGKKDQAISVYKKYLDKQPKDYEVAYIVGEFAYTNKNYDDAYRYLGMVVGDQARTAAFLGMYGQTCFQKKDFAKAKELYGELALLTPQNAEVYKTLYTIASQDPEQKGAAATYLKKYTALRPNDAGAQKNLGDLLYERKDFPGSLAAYRKAIALDPAVKGIYKRYFEMASAQGLTEDISAALKGAIAAGEADAGMYNIQGMHYQKAGMYPQAIQMFQKALSSDPKNTAILMALGSCQVKAGSMTEAAVTYEQVLEVNPQDIGVYKMLGEMYIQQKKTDQALSVYKKYLEKQPKDYAVAYWIGEVEYHAKNYDEAAKYFAMVGGEEARKTAFLNMYAQTCMQRKDFTKAKELYHELVLIEPANADIFKALYDMAVKDNDKDAAISNLKKYLSLRPRDAEAQKDLGDYLYDQKELSPAFLAYRAALEADPNIKGVYKRYAELVVSRGTPEEVLTVLTNSVNAGEADAQTYSTLGSIYEKKLLLPKAIAFYNKALQLDQRNTTILSALARCQLKAGSTADAIVTYQQVVAINPDATQECKVLGDLYMKQKRKDDAIEAYKKYLAKSSADPEIALLVADESFKKKDYEETIKYLNKAEKGNSQDLEYLYLYGRAYYYSKNYRKSAEIFERMRSVIREQKQKYPHQAAMLRMLADSYEKSGDNANAASILAAYTKLPDVNDPEASYEKAVLAEASSPATAAKYYEENTVQYPKDYRNYFGAGLIYAKQPANMEKALALLKKGLSIKDTIPQLWLEMGRMYGKLGKIKQEVEAYQNFIQRDASNPDACEEIGVTLLNKHMLNDAMVFLEMANALKAGNPDYMYQLARGYVKTDRIADALPLLEKAEKLKPDDDKIKSLYNFVLQKSSGGGGQAPDQ
ncbi:MAG TPA: tetratricopeptide repeat protein [Chitinivibrionales bacterium]|nr:tetratricopeptide repeat protein [Chitinivibrionales bacterium]